LAFWCRGAVSKVLALKSTSARPSGLRGDSEVCILAMSLWTTP
jgi:hypothetical protein